MVEDTCVYTLIKSHTHTSTQHSYGGRHVSVYINEIIHTYIYTTLRWWKTRDCLGIVIGRSVDIAMMFAMYIRGYDAESDK